MKKMSKIFELPIGRVNLMHLLDKTSCEEDAAIINAINHVDALAEALEIMIDSNWKSAHERQCAQLVSKAALARYRGEA